MNKIRTTMGIAFAVGLCIGVAAIANSSKSRARPQPTALVAPLPPDPSHDIGTGERLLFAIAGTYDAEAEAQRANDSFHFGDMRGFTVVPTRDVQGMESGRWLLASGFRTRAGAEDFTALARRAGASSLHFVVARYLGTRYIGLGQEMRPDGKGPLIGPLPSDDPNRIR